MSTVTGRSNDDTVSTGVGQDTLYGGGGADSISSQGGDDLLYGGSGNDTIAGGTGEDTIYGGNDNITDFRAGNEVPDISDLNDSALCPTAPPIIRKRAIETFLRFVDLSLGCLST